VEDHLNSWWALGTLLFSFPFLLRLNRFPLPFPSLLDDLLFGDFTEPWVSGPSISTTVVLPPLSPLQASDLDWVNSIEGGLIHSPLEPALDHPLSSYDADPSVFSEIGPVVAPPFPLNKGFISARLEPDEYSGCE
jgi:hypothetical protein